MVKKFDLRKFLFPPEKTKVEKMKAYQKIYRQENKQKMKAYQKIYRQENKQEIKVYYQKNKQKKKTYQKARYQTRKEEFKWVSDLKRTKGCLLCGETNPDCLDFHHPDPTTKVQRISYMILKGYSQEEIKIEINKCQILCSNCHRKEMAKDRKKKK